MAINLEFSDFSYAFRQYEKSTVAFSNSPWIKDACQFFDIDCAFHLCLNLPHETNVTKFKHVLHSPSNCYVRETAKFIAVNPADKTNNNFAIHLHLFRSELAAEQHVGLQGVRSISIVTDGQLGETSIFSMFSERSDFEWKHFKQRNFHDLEIYSKCFHRNALALSRGAGHDFERKLTRREIEVLRWSSIGKTYKDIALQLGISSRTVRFFLENARQKLGCTNTTHAVTDAVRRGII